MSIIDFLLARLAEDEAGATVRTFSPGDAPVPFEGVEFDLTEGRVYVGRGLGRTDITDEYHAWMRALPLSASSKRTLAEVEAKRRIMARFADVVDAGFDACGDGRVTLGHLASVYADHPDYDPEWGTS